MTREDDLLAREIGRAGRVGGQIGGGLAGAIGGGEGGALGARMAARLLKTKRHRVEFTLAQDGGRILACARSFLESNGRIADDHELDPSECQSVRGVIGSGSMNLNPTIIYVEIISDQANACTVSVLGAAKEGLIPQRSAEKAVERVAQALRQS